MIDIFRIISFFGIIILPASFGASERRKTLKRNARKRARDAKALQKAARAPATHREAQRLQGEADAALADSCYAPPRLSKEIATYHEHDM